MYKKIILFIFSLLATAVYSWSQCAMCKAVAENGSEEASKGLNTGILYLMSLPYILVGIIGVVMYRMHKKRQKLKHNID